MKAMKSIPGVSVSHVIDSNLEAAKSLSKEWDVENQATTIAEALSQSPVDGFVISTPTGSHIPLIKDITSQAPGTPIFTEKPVADNAKDINEAFKIAQAAGSEICCSFQRRFDQTYVRASEAVSTGSIGRVHNVNVIFGDHPCPPIEFLVDGGDIFMDLAPHDLDYIFNALDDTATSVYATGCSSDPVLEEKGVLDNALMVVNMKKVKLHEERRLERSDSKSYILTTSHSSLRSSPFHSSLRSSQGAVVTMQMSRSAVFGYDQRCEFFGTAGSASVTNPKEHDAVVRTVDGSNTARFSHSFPERFQTGFKRELESFTEVVLGKGTWPVTENDCTVVQTVADAARRRLDQARSEGWSEATAKHFTTVLYI